MPKSLSPYGVVTKVWPTERKLINKIITKQKGYHTKPYPSKNDVPAKAARSVGGALELLDEAEKKKPNKGHILKYRKTYEHHNALPKANRIEYRGVPKSRKKITYAQSSSLPKTIGQESFPRTKSVSMHKSSKKASSKPPSLDSASMDIVSGNVHHYHLPNDAEIKAVMDTMPNGGLEGISEADFNANIADLQKHWEAAHAKPPTPPRDSTSMNLSKRLITTTTAPKKKGPNMKFTKPKPAIQKKPKKQKKVKEPPLPAVDPVLIWDMKKEDSDEHHQRVTKYFNYSAGQCMIAYVQKHNPMMKKMTVAYYLKHIVKAVDEFGNGANAEKYINENMPDYNIQLFLENNNFKMEDKIDKLRIR